MVQFLRSEENGDQDLLVTLKLKYPVLKDKIHRFFWYLKESNDRLDDMISGKVTYQRLEVSSDLG